MGCGASSPAGNMVRDPSVASEQKSVEDVAEIPTAGKKIPTGANRYIIEKAKELGRGHFAHVVKCRDVVSNTIYAMKIIDKKECAASHAVVTEEIGILKAVGTHRHIVSLVDSYDDAVNYYLIMELCEGGDLFSKIVETGAYSEQQAARVCRQLAEALQFIHSKGITHRDLKPENILLITNDINSDIKVADFGLSKVIAQGQMMKTVCGTWAYCAPEVIQRKHYTSAVDNWTLGVLMFVLLCGYHPFDVYGELPEPQLLAKIVSCQYDFADEAWNEVSQSAKDVIQKLLKTNPSERMSLRAYLESPWSSNAKKQSNQRLAARMSKIFV